MRAVVISPRGESAPRNTWTIAYVEKYTPELKVQMEMARASGGSPPMGRTAAQAHRLVKRIADKDWVPLVSPEGEKIDPRLIRAMRGAEDKTGHTYGFVMLKGRITAAKTKRGQRFIIAQSFSSSTAGAASERSTSTGMIRVNTMTSLKLEA